MSTRILLGVKTAGAKPPSSADVTESGSLNLLELSGTHRPVVGMLYCSNVLRKPQLLTYCVTDFE
jgi:hypothetical protein